MIIFLFTWSFSLNELSLYVALIDILKVLLKSCVIIKQESFLKVIVWDWEEKNIYLEYYLTKPLGKLFFLNRIMQSKGPRKTVLDVYNRLPACPGY